MDWALLRPYFTYSSIRLSNNYFSENFQRVSGIWAIVYSFYCYVFILFFFPFLISAFSVLCFFPYLF